VKVAPRPARDLAWIVPPCASTIWRSGEVGWEGGDQRRERLDAAGRGPDDD
jgi:hypothetical protein